MVQPDFRKIAQRVMERCQVQDMANVLGEELRMMWEAGAGAALGQPKIGIPMTWESADDLPIPYTVPALKPVVNVHEMMRHILVTDAVVPESVETVRANGGNVTGLAALGPVEITQGPVEDDAV